MSAPTMTEYIGSTQPYYAKDGKVWKAAIRKAGPNGGTSITMGFPVCTMHDVAEGQEALVAALMNRGDIADELLEALKAAREKMRIELGGAREYVGGMPTQTLFPMIDALIAKADAIP